MGGITAADIIKMAEENRLAEEQRKLRQEAEESDKLRQQVTTEVDTFLADWLKEMKANEEKSVRKVVLLDEAETVFASLSVAREILYGRGISSRILPQKTRGILLWKKIVRPAVFVVFPAKQQQ